MDEQQMQHRGKIEAEGVAENSRSTPTFIPAVDIFETEDALTLVVELPGVSADNVSIDVRENQLILHGKVAPVGESERVLRSEYATGDYSRQFTLGRMIDQSKIGATLKDGLLTLTLPKADLSKPRKITVKVS